MDRLIARAYFENGRMYR